MDIKNKLKSFKEKTASAMTMLSLVFCMWGTLPILSENVYAAGVVGEVPAQYTLSCNGHAIYLYFNCGNDDDRLQITSPTAGEWILNNRPNVHVTFYSSKYGYYETDVFYTSSITGQLAGPTGYGVEISQTSSNWDCESSGGSRKAMSSAWLKNAQSGNQFYPVSVSIDNLPPAHTHDSSGYVAPTCTANGYYYCMGCGEVMSYVSSPGHSWYEYAAPTCTTAGIDKCSTCGETKGGRDKLGHSWSAATISKNNGAKTEPDVYNNGVYYQTCSRCTNGSSDDPYTDHYNVVEGSQKHFNIFVGNNRVQKIYLGEILIYNLDVGETSLVV